MIRASILSALGAFSISGCVTHEVRPEGLDPVIAEHEARLLMPYRRGATVVCQTLTIEVNPVFFKHLSRPAGPENRTTGEDYEELSWQTHGRVITRSAAAGGSLELSPVVQHFYVKIADTMFVVDREVRIRLLHRAPPTLTAVALGTVMVTTDGKTAEYFDQVRYADGQVANKTK